MNKHVFIIVLRYLVDLEEVLKHRPSHVEFLKRGYAQGMFIVSGRQTPPTGGVIVARAASRADLWKFLQEDPFFTEGCAEYQVFDFEATNYTKAFAAILEE